MIRLRALRNMSQADLAEKMGTKQPAVARLESGHANPRLETLVLVAKQLDAVVRIDMSPREALEDHFHMMQWWERPSHTGAVSRFYNQHAVVTSRGDLPAGGYHIYNIFNSEPGPGEPELPTRHATSQPAVMASLNDVFAFLEADKTVELCSPVDEVTP